MARNAGFGTSGFRLMLPAPSGWPGIGARESHRLVVRHVVAGRMEERAHHHVGARELKPGIPFQSSFTSCRRLGLARRRLGDPALVPPRFLWVTVHGFSGSNVESGPRINASAGIARRWFRFVNQVELGTSSKAFTLTASRRVRAPKTPARPRSVSGMSNAWERGWTSPS